MMKKMYFFNILRKKKSNFVLCNFLVWTLQCFFKKKFTFFLPLKIWKKNPEKLLIVGPDPLFQYCQSARIQPKSQLLFHKNLSPQDFSIMTLSLTEHIVEKSGKLCILWYWIDFLSHVTFGSNLGAAIDINA